MRYTREEFISLFIYNSAGRAYVKEDFGTFKNYRKHKGALTFRRHKRVRANRRDAFNMIMAIVIGFYSKKDKDAQYRIARNIYKAFREGDKP